LLGRSALPAMASADSAHTSKNWRIVQIDHVKRKFEIRTLLQRHGFINVNGFLG